MNLELVQHSKIKITLLIVEDSPSTRFSLMMMVGFDPNIEIVSAVATTREALETLHSQPLVILMDMTLPDIDGISAISQIKEKLPTAKIILMSVEERYQPHALAGGAEAFLAKPFCIDKLLNTIYAVLSTP
jgi:DNA-binding NarL/FixJ family response regulator